MFERDEASSCPWCGLALQSLGKLVPAKTLLHEFEDDGIAPPPELVPFSIVYPGLGRGAMVAFGVLGLGLFFAAWIHLSLPEVTDLSGFDLSRRLGWSWGAAIAWGVLVPTVASRRTVAQLRGARFPAAFLSLIPGVTVAILALRSPHGRLFPVRFTYGWPFWATMAVSVVAAGVGSRLGGGFGVSPVSPVPPRNSDGGSVPTASGGQDNLGGETLH
jgi:hypothetical protein